ncbi:cyclopropane-fatty-acyl-phospholipid synthase family protein [Rhodococcus sp. X156]|uniref:SAM-dependent methyltransferase n=1 Tax=Rhodococcus sp. X156 TaxID=2499145 RepID=UPI001F49CA33|nr:cyclopropane-fatty-acyl-phospholipid synthase family protein [Rhodococcus sp. X156]
MRASGQRRPVVEELRPILRGLLGEDFPLRLRAWDGSEAGPPDSPATLVIRTPRAMRRFLWSPDELGLGRAYVSGDLDIEGDLYAALSLPDLLAAEERPDLSLSWPDRLGAVRTALRLRAVGLPPAPPPEESRLRGRRHALRRDADAIAHHYDVGNEFYRLVLGETMTYSCGYWPTPESTLDQAQEAKYALIATKLGLRPGMRLLDIGCGWGGMVLHAAREHGVHAVGVTISTAQAELARKRVAEAGLSDLVEIRLQDYREVSDGPYDAISSIGMAEHVGQEQLQVYANQVHGLLAPGGRLLNHAISRRPGPVMDPRRSFLVRYVFPDGELHPLATTVDTLEQAGLEVRDVESLREHYARTCRAWVQRLDDRWDEAVELGGPGRARVWRLYLAASALAFEQLRTGLNQVLAVRPDAQLRSGLPPTRGEWLG